MTKTEQIFAYDEPHPTGGNARVTMTREQAIAEMRRTYPGSYARDDERAIEDWLAMNFAYPALPDRATVAAALTELQAKFQRRTGEGAGTEWRTAFNLASSELAELMAKLRVIDSPSAVQVIQERQND